MAPTRALLLGASALVLGVAVSAAGDCKSCSDTAFKATNDYRASKGLAPYGFSESMYKRCQQHNRDMAARDDLYHTSLGGGVFAENVAYRSNGGDVGALMTQQWIDSPGHERNIRSDNPCGATGIYDDGSRSWGTQMFGKCDEGSPPADTQPPRTSPEKTDAPAMTEAPGDTRPPTPAPEVTRPAPEVTEPVPAPEMTQAPPRDSGDRDGDCRSCSDTAFKATNDYRASKGLAPYGFSESMYKRCQQHNRDMAARDDLYHTSLGGGVFAENVAYRSNGGDVGALMTQQWIDSPGHERNIRSDNPCGATGIYDDGSRSWGTQMFGKCDEGSPSQPEGDAPDTAPDSKEEPPASDDESDEDGCFMDCASPCVSEGQQEWWKDEKVRECLFRCVSRCAA